MLGPNGAGKTTTIRMLATLTRPDGGSARSLLGDSVRSLVAGTVMIVLGVILGYRPEASYRLPPASTGAADSPPGFRRRLSAPVVSV